MSRPLDDHMEFVGPPSRLEVERFGWRTLYQWVPRFLRWHLWAKRDSQRGER